MERVGGSNPPSSTTKPSNQAIWWFLRWFMAGLATPMNRIASLGAIAQLVAHLHGMERVGGSNPPSSTIKAGASCTGLSRFLAYRPTFAQHSPEKGAADIFLETERKDFRMSGLEERERAVELYFTTPMTTAQVVEHLGYPTRQCLERWLAMDSRYAGHMAKPIIPLETRRRAVELVLGGMQQKQAAKQLGVSVGAVHGWVRAYRKGGMAALQPKNRNSAQGNKPAGSRRWPSAADDDDAEALRRRVEELELENALMREVMEVRRKRPRRRPAAPVEQGEDPVDRPVEAGVFARLDGMLARHRAERPPTATTPGSELTSTPDSGRRWPGRSPIPRAGTGTAGSRRCSRPAYRRSRSAGSWRRKGSWRMCPSDAGIVPTRARRRRLPPISSTGTSRPSVRTRSG